MGHDRQEPRDPGEALGEALAEASESSAGTKSGEGLMVRVETVCTGLGLEMSVILKAAEDGEISLASWVSTIEGSYDRLEGMTIKVCPELKGNRAPYTVKCPKCMDRAYVVRKGDRYDVAEVCDCDLGLKVEASTWFKRVYKRGRRGALTVQSHISEQMKRYCEQKGRSYADLKARIKELKQAQDASADERRRRESEFYED